MTLLKDLLGGAKHSRHSIAESLGVSLRTADRWFKILKELPGVELDARGCVVADPATGATGNPKVFAGGDCINGGKEVVNAVADGRNSARLLLRRWSETV